MANDAHDAPSAIFLAPFSIPPASNEKRRLSAIWTAGRRPSRISAAGDGRVSSTPRHLVGPGHGNSDDARKAHDAVDAQGDDDAGCPSHLTMRRHFDLTYAPSKALIVPRVSRGHPKPSPDSYEAPRNSQKNAVLHSGLFRLWPRFPFFSAELRHTIPMRCTSLDDSSRAR